MFKETLLLLTLAALLAAVECLGESPGNSSELVERDNDNDQEEVDLATTQSMLNKRGAPHYPHKWMRAGVKIQQRVAGSAGFYRTWNEYVNGFGDKNTNFWLGLKEIHELSHIVVKLRVDLWFTGMGYEDPNGFEESEWMKSKFYRNEHKYAIYDKFEVGSAATNYRLRVSGYHGTAGDALWRQNGVPFSTKDRDNDGNAYYNYALMRTGAWWYNEWASSNLNGDNGAVWLPFTGGNPAYRVEMKIWIEENCITQCVNN